MAPMTPQATWSLIILIAVLIGFIMYIAITKLIPPVSEEPEAEVFDLDDYRDVPVDQPGTGLRLIVGGNAMVGHHYDTTPYDWARDGL